MPSGGRKCATGARSTPTAQNAKINRQGLKLTALRIDGLIVRSAANYFHGRNDDGLDGNVVVPAERAGGDFAYAHGGEHGIFVRRFAERGVLPVEVGTVGDADKELRRRAVGIGGARHGDDARFVSYVVVRAAVGAELAGYALLRGLAVQSFAVRRHTAALYHKAGYDAVHAKSVVESLFRKVDEVGDRRGRLVGAQDESHFAAVRHRDDGNGSFAVSVHSIFSEWYCVWHARRATVANCALCRCYTAIIPPVSANVNTSRRGYIA